MGIRKSPHIKLAKKQGATGTIPIAVQPAVVPRVEPKKVKPKPDMGVPDFFPEEAIDNIAAKFDALDHTPNRPDNMSAFQAMTYQPQQISAADLNIRQALKRYILANGKKDQFTMAAGNITTSHRLNIFTRDHQYAFALRTQQEQRGGVDYPIWLVSCEVNRRDSRKRGGWKQLYEFYISGPDTSPNETPRETYMGSSVWSYKNDGHIPQPKAEKLLKAFLYQLLEKEKLVP